MLAHFLFVMLATAAPLRPLPDGVAYRNHPASVKEMLWLSGRWWSKNGSSGSLEKPGNWIILRPDGPGWLHMGDGRDPKVDTAFPVTSHDGKLYVHVDMCAVFGDAADLARCRYQGEPCQYPFLIEHYPDDTTNLRGIDRVKSHAANPWLRPAPPPTENLFEDRCDGALFGMSEADQERFLFVAAGPSPAPEDDRYHRLRAGPSSHGKRGRRTRLTPPPAKAAAARTAAK